MILITAVGVREGIQRELAASQIGGSDTELILSRSKYNRVNILTFHFDKDIIYL